MPPRLPSFLAPRARPLLSSSFKLVPTAATTSSSSLPSSVPSSQPQFLLYPSQVLQSQQPSQCSQCRSFTTTPTAEYRINRAWDRRLYFMAKGKGRKYGMDLFYREGAGSKLKTPTPGTPNYLGILGRDGQRITPLNQPFPANPYYIAHPVLSEGLREEAWRRVVEEGKGVRRVSAELSIEMERVAACVRLMEIEKRWEKDGKDRKTHLTAALHSMMPVTPYEPSAGTNEIDRPHETITDFLMHPNTKSHNFVTMSESALVDRQRAGDMMGILPTHLGMMHAELVDIEKEKLQGLSPADQEKLEEERVRLEKAQKDDKLERERLRRAGQTIVESDRWRFRLREAKAGVVGYRYGVPHPDRKRAQIKIPTKVI